MRKHRHSLEHLSRLPEEVADCDILQVRIVSQDVRQQRETPCVVTTIALEVWERKPPDARIETLGSALTVLRCKAGRSRPLALVETPSIENGLIGVDRFRDEEAAMGAMVRKFKDLVAGFITLPAGDGYDPAA